MALQELKIKIELEARIKNISSCSEDDLKIVSYLDVLEYDRYKRIGVINIMEMIKQGDEQGYEKLCYILAVESIKNLKVMQKPRDRDEVKDSKDKKDITFWLNKIQEEKGEN
jgi:hypothetical protein